MIETIWLFEAIEDLKSIGVVIAKENKRAAYETLTRLKTAVDGLSRHPHMGRQGRVKNTRELSVSGVPYIIVYQITDTNIRILAILHTARKWPDTFDNKEQ